jgi:hypothetical protein
LRQTLSAPGPWLVALCFAVYSSQWVSVIGFLPSIYAQAGISGGTSAWLTALAAAVNMVGNAVTGRLLGSGLRPQRLLMVGYAVMAVSACVAFVGLDLPPALRYGAVLIFSMVGGVIPGTLFTLAVRLAPNEHTVSTAIGWMQQWSAIGQFAGPPLVAWVASRTGGWQDLGGHRRAGRLWFGPRAPGGEASGEAKSGAVNHEPIKRMTCPPERESDASASEFQRLAQTVDADMRRWLERAVIGLNLCPFAKSVHVKGQVHYVVSPAQDAKTLLATLKDELKALEVLDAVERDTTLLIAPLMLGEFLDFNDFLDQADRVLRKLRLDGVFQIASFHPQFQFADTAADDITNFTNRAPYPTLHLLREASIDRAVQAYPDAENIFGKNIQTLQSLGHSGWAALDVGPRGKIAP